MNPIKNLAIILILVASGCTAIPTTHFDYIPVSIDTDAQQPPKGLLVVKDFDDKRPQRYITHPMAKIWLTYVPVLPYVNMPYERIEETFAKGHQTEVKELPTSMAEMVAKDISTTGIFKEVRYIGSDSIPADADYVLSGNLVSTQYDINTTSYMLGMGGVLLWILPIPVGNQVATVDLNLALTTTSGEKVWSDHVTGEASKLYSLYWPTRISLTRSINVTHYGDNKEGIDGNSILAYHASALREGMTEAKRSLAKAMAAK